MSTQTKNKSGVVHFSIGEDFGIRIMEIAQEHLLYDYNPKKAIETITDSLSGCPIDLGLKILKGDIVLLVDVKEQFIIPAERDDTIHSMFPKIDISEWYKRKHNQIGENGRGIYKALEIAVTNITNTGYVEIDSQSIFDYIKNNDTNTLLECILENDEVYHLLDVIRVAKEYLSTTFKVWNVMDFLEKTYPNEIYDVDKNPLDAIDTGRHNVVYMVQTRLTQLISGSVNSILKTIDEENKEVENYITSSIEIENVLSEGIKPVDIMENWSAGWLSPEGNYYALNGEIANMLHIQIANALYEAGIIPKDEVDKIQYGDNSPYVYLEQQGWVKIHGNVIHFAGCLNSQQNLKNVDITPVQIETIYKYISLKHNSILKLGWREELTSASKFHMFANSNLPSLYKNYFEY